MSKRKTPAPGRSGFTLVEILIYAMLAAVVLGVAYFMLYGGAREATYGMAYSSVQAGITDFTEHLMNDLDQMVVHPDRSGRLAVRIGRRGDRLALLLAQRPPTESVFTDIPVVSPGTVWTDRTPITTEQLRITAFPILYHPVSRGDGTFFPARGKQVMHGCILSYWSFRLLPKWRSRPGTPSTSSGPQSPDSTTTTTPAPDSPLTTAVAGAPPWESVPETLGTSAPLEPLPPGARGNRPDSNADETDAELLESLLVKPGGNSAERTAATTPGAASIENFELPGMNVSSGSFVTKFGTPLPPQVGAQELNLSLSVRFTAVDDQRRVAEHRELLWDLDTARLIRYFEHTYPLGRELYQTTRDREEQWP